jgi:hypothetical protein
MALIGEPAANSNFAERRGAFVDQALRQRNAPVQYPAMR